MVKMKIIIRDGKKLYPTARWETSAHKIEYFLEKCYVKLESWYFTGQEISRSEEEYLEKRIKYLEDLVSRYNPEQDGFVYLPYSDYKEVREMIAKYDMKH